MGDRRERPTKRLDNSDLMALAKQSLMEDTASAVPSQAEPDPDAAAPDDDPFADWDDVQPPGVAVGSQSNALPTTSRTATLADPLTTQLLAEVARRTSTMEFDPDEVIAEVQGGRAKRDTREIDPDVLSAALRGSEAAPVAASPTPNVRRRTK